MNRILNFKVFSAIAVVVFLIACSSTQNDPIPPGGDQQQTDSSSSITGEVLPSSGSEPPLPLSSTPDEPALSSGSELPPPLSSDSGNLSSSTGQEKGGDGVDLSSSASRDPSSSSVDSGSSSSVAQSSSSVLSSSDTQTSSSSRSSTSSSSVAQIVSSSSKPNLSSSSVASNPAPGEKVSYTEKVGSVSFDMVYIPGGTFTIGCESGSCPADTRAVSGVTVSNYFISKTEVTNGLWKAVMGSDIPPPQYAQSSGSATHITWYDAMEFACKLSNMTGKNYRMTTEAEWEYAAKKYLSKLEQIAGGAEEWAYNSWLSTHDGGTDPVGPSSGQHTQKTRRDAQGTADAITGRLIRSIEGVGPALRLAVSADVAFPPKYVSPCNLHAPKMEGEPTNSYRDPRWVTGSGSVWKPDGTISIGNFEFRAWEDGTARLCDGYTNSCANGQWFTSNNIALVFVPSSGAIKKHAYIFVDETHVSLIPNDNAGNPGFIGRLAKQEASNYDKPPVSGLKSGEELAKAAGDEYKMVDMVNIPASAQKQDARLLDGGSTKGWFQNNSSAGGVHHYRKDIDADEFRFTVNQNNGRTMLANGKWFTINNTFLRVTHSNGYTAEYLYSVTPDGTFYHNSFMGYERGDFRMFKKETNGDAWPKTTCGDVCSEEIPKGLSASIYNGMANGKSTFVPAPCPAGGCK